MGDKGNHLNGKREANKCARTYHTPPKQDLPIIRLDVEACIQEFGKNRAQNKNSGGPNEAKVKNFYPLLIDCDLNQGSGSERHDGKAIDGNHCLFPIVKQRFLLWRLLHSLKIFIIACQ